MLRLEQAGLDGEQILMSLPSWRRHLERATYGPVHAFDDTGGTNGVSVPRLRLTFLGRHHIGDGQCVHINETLLIAIAAAAEARADLINMPLYEPFEMVIPVAPVVAAVAKSGRAADSADLSLLFATEPPTWAMNPRDGQGRWRANNADIRLYRKVRSIKDYLQTLNEWFLAPPPNATSVAAPPPIALLEALDHLDLAWQLAFGAPLLGGRMLAGPAELTQPVSSGAEFNSRCTALKDIFDKLLVPTPLVAATGSPPGTLVRLKRTVQERLLDQGARADTDRAVRVLTDVATVRNAQQHGGMATKVVAARVRLGLSRFAGDWTSDWNTIQHSTIEALRTIRELLVSTLPAAGATEQPPKTLRLPN